MATSSSLAKLGRWILLLATVLMGGALLLTVWSTNRAVNGAAELLVRGQADFLHRAVRSELFRARAVPTDASLAAAVDALEAEGLLFMAVLGRGGEVVARGGTPAGPLDDLPAPAGRGGEIFRIGSRVRAVFHGPPRPRGPGFGMGWDAPFTMVIDFDPRIASGLLAAAHGTFAVGAVAAGAFLAVALLLVRWLLSRESTERRREHERQLANLGRMSAILAHEIRNPLASLKGNAQLLARALPEGERPRAKADLVIAEAVRLEALVADLLEFARAGALKRTDVDPAALLREVAGARDPDRIDVKVEGAPARFPLDRERMRQVLSNLVENALDAGDGRVELSARVAGRRLVLQVRDHGPGIPPEDLERIFEPFFTRRTHGTGLGLAVARRLVELHGGTLAAQSGEAGGAVFTVEVPG